jgi:multidrug resistance efflux pump
MEQLLLAPTPAHRSGRRIGGRTEPRFLGTQGDSLAIGENLVASKILELFAVALGHEKFADAASAFVTELAQRFGCTQVSIGFLQQRDINVAAVSHVTDFREHQNLVSQIASAMDECIDQGITVQFPPPASAKPQITRFHSELSKRQGGAAICSVPIVRSGTACGALTFERAEDSFADHTRVQIEHVAALIGPVLILRRERDRPLRTVLRERGGAFLKGLFGRAYLAPKLVSGAIVAILAAAAIWQVDYRVSAPARLEGSVQRVTVAPADGFLKQVHVRAGSVVKQGQVLASLEQDAVELERRKWESEIAQHQNAYREAIAKHDRSGAVTSVARIDEARAQLALIEDKLGRTNIVAPFDGVIIKGDLSQSLGAPVKQGDTLFTLAPSADYRVIVEVDERDIAQLAHGSPGTLMLAALSSDPIAISVQRVTPVANTSDGRNYFSVEAKLNDQRVAQRTALRPGLKGVAKVNAGQRSLLWVWTHRVVDSLRLLTWSWTR